MTAYSDRTKLELRKFADALAALEEAALENETRMARDSLLLRYVFTFEMAWQAMRQVLLDRGDTETPRVAFSTLDTAFKVGIVRDPAPGQLRKAERRSPRLRRSRSDCIGRLGQAEALPTVRARRTWSDGHRMETTFGIRRRSRLD